MAAAVEGTCYDCGEPCEIPFIAHPGCCPHDEEIVLDVTGPVESRDSGTCDDCGAHVHIEVDGPEHSFDMPREIWVRD